LADINVYEVDTGTPEFQLMDILVSVDNIVFTSIKASEKALVRIIGDSVHGEDDFGRSYDLGAFGSVRYVRIDGTGPGHAGGINSFDLDAIGAHDVVYAGGPAVPEPASSVLVLTGLAAIARRVRRRR
jgi:hypothetical protein